MGEKFENLPTPEEREERKEILTEMKEIAHSESPSPKEDWDLIWVLSGPEKSPADAPGQGKRNENKDRLETAFKIAKAVVALRLGREKEDITQKEIASFGPDVYFNGLDDQNDALRDLIEKGFLENYDFPKEKFIISANLGLKHTGDQFEKIEESVLAGKRKIAIVSSLYHLPRIRRYVKMHQKKIDLEKIILYSAEPRQIPVGAGLGEIKKIPRYEGEGILPSKSKYKK
ncbi:MAG: hypothetical protein Q8Q48_03140 [Candidatus Staskawiczbacteria bacterium]|nr:hypothetical protein [Candidatus Staskawiczbacteria bacterium]